MLVEVPIYLNSIFAILQFEISSFMNLIKLGKNPVHQTGELRKSSADRYIGGVSRKRLRLSNRENIKVLGLP